MWPTVLSDRLPIAGTVGRYPAVYLIGRGPVPGRRAEARLSPWGRSRCQRRFPAVVPGPGVGSHALLTRAPLAPRRGRARLACVRRAASVRPEPGSNSQLRPGINWLQRSTVGPAQGADPARPTRRCASRRPRRRPHVPSQQQPTDDGKEHPRRRRCPVRQKAHCDATIDYRIPLKRGGKAYVGSAQLLSSQPAPFPARHRHRLLARFCLNGDRRTLGGGMALGQERDRVFLSPSPARTRGPPSSWPATSSRRSARRERPERPPRGGRDPASRHLASLVARWYPLANAVHAVMGRRRGGRP